MLRELILVCGLFVIIFSHPTGVQNIFCRMINTNEPIHNVTSQPHSTLPYHVVASNSSFQSGSTVQVKIDGDTIVGFLVQGRDSNTHEWIGQFQSSHDVHLIPECGAISHSDPKEKTEITLTWQAPQNQQGSVYFVALIMKNITTYWSHVHSTVKLLPLHE